MLLPCVALTAIASIVSDAATEIGAVYRVDAAVGAVRLIV
jgi:hypothetical protein